MIMWRVLNIEKYLQDVKKYRKRDPFTAANGPGNVEIASEKEEKQSKRQGYHVGCHSAEIRKRESTGVNLWE